MNVVGFIDLVRGTRVLAAVAAGALFGGCAQRPAGVVDGGGDRRVEGGGAEVRRAMRAEEAGDVGRGRLEIDDVARFLAGLSGRAGSGLAGYREGSWWGRHAGNLDQLWDRFNAQRRDPINSWGARELGGLRSAHVLFYPFSGPDFLYANAFFPDAGTVVLCGLEAAEPLPELTSLSESELEAGLAGLSTALTSSLNFSFFITRDMRVDLERTRLRGTLPILLTFLARAHERITAVEWVSLDPAGTVVAHGGGRDAGFRIRCGSGRTVYYFTTNLANGSFTPNGRFATFVRGLGPCVSFTKSASYLMHTDDFSNVRNFILQWSAAVLQDDSGIPFEAFPPERWTLTCFGRYTGTIDLFKGYYQPALAAAHARESSPLGFGIGYKHNEGQSAMLLARRR